MSGEDGAPLSLHGKPVETVFELLGRDENAMTFALGWCLTKVPVLLDEVAVELGDTGEPRPSASSPVVRLQEHRSSTGITDIEVHAPGRLAWIVEAKQGFRVPGAEQMEKYALRLGEVGDPGAARRLVVLARSDRRGAWLRSAVPSAVHGIPVSALSWGQVARAVGRARADAGHAAGRLLDEFTGFLDRVAPMKDETSNMAYVVSLSRGTFGGQTTFVEVVEKHAKYFHPVGGGRGGWPVNPPNYMAFRYDNHLQSIHHVDDYEVITDFHPHFPDVPPGAIPPHFLYHLGPPIRPPRPVPTGKSIMAMRMHCFIDTLLTAETIMDAHAVTGARWKAMKDAR